MEKIKTLKYHNEIVLNTSLYKYLSIINDEKVANIIQDVIYDNFIMTTQTFLRDGDEETINKYREEMRVPYHKYIEKTMSESWFGIKNNLLVSSFNTFDMFLNHLVSIYYKNFSKLYSGDDVKISFAVIKDFKNMDELRDHILNMHIDEFAAMGFKEKIIYIKKTLKLNDDEIWIMNRRDLLQDIYKIRNLLVHAETAQEIPDSDFYLYINYLCSLIFKLSEYSRIKYGIEFEWIKDLSRYLSLADKREERKH
jgi:hypothetical protein